MKNKFQPIINSVKEKLRKQFKIDPIEIEEEEEIIEIEDDED